MSKANSTVSTGEAQARDAASHAASTPSSSRQREEPQQSSRHTEPVSSKQKEGLQESSRDTKPSSRNLKEGTQQPSHAAAPSQPARRIPRLTGSHRLPSNNYPDLVEGRRRMNDISVEGQLQSCVHWNNIRVMPQDLESSSEYIEEDTPRNLDRRSRAPSPVSAGRSRFVEVFEERLEREKEVSKSSRSRTSSEGRIVEGFDDESDQSLGMAVPTGNLLDSVSTKLEKWIIDHKNENEEAAEFSATAKARGQAPANVRADESPQSLDEQ